VADVTAAFSAVGLTCGSAPTGPAPTITSFLCPIAGTNAGGSFSCSVAYTSGTTAVIRWPTGSSSNFYDGYCTPGANSSVTVSVSNRYGTTSRTATFRCNSGNIP
jgi:hypothetical protein